MNPELSSNQPLRAAIHGCGRIAGFMDVPGEYDPVMTHAQAYHQIEGVKLVGVSDRTVGRSSQFGAIWDIEVCEDSLPDMLANAKPDVLSLCSRSVEHADDLVACIHHPNCPRVILTEKPLCLDAQEASRIEKAMTGRPVSLVVNHTRRFDPVHREMARRIAGGEFGAFVAGNAWYYGGWQNNGTHMVDTLRMLIGQVTGWDSASQGYEGREGDPCLDVTLQFDNAHVRVESVPEDNYQLFEYELRFEESRLRFEDFGSRVCCERVAVNAIDERELTACDDFPRTALTNPLYHAVLFTTESVLSESPPEMGASYSEALETMRIIWDVQSTINSST